MQADFCFDAATEGATGGLLLSPTRRCSKAKDQDRPRGLMPATSPQLFVAVYTTLEQRALW